MKFIKGIIIAIILASYIDTNAQDSAIKNTIITNEIGVFLGPVFMQTDYLTESTNTGTGVDFGVAYIADFSNSRYKSKAFAWISDHMKTRVELSFSKVNLEHDDVAGPESNRFKAMTGDTKLFNFGVFGEWYFMSLTKKALKFQPYFLTGASYTSAKSSLSYDISLGLPTVYTTADRLFIEKNSAVSFTNGLGFRYKLDDVDFVAEGRYQAFLSDRIEGIDTDLSDDEHNDSQVLFKFGIVFHLN